MAAKGTPAVTEVVQAGIVHRVHEYEHEPGAASYGLEAAEKLGVDPDRVFDTIYVSAGRRGLEIELAPGDLVRLTGARVAAVASRG